MPFWTLFWLIVPAVVLLTAAVVFYLRTAHHGRESGRDGGRDGVRGGAPDR